MLKKFLEQPINERTFYLKKLLLNFFTMKQIIIDMKTN